MEKTNCEKRAGYRLSSGFIPYAAFLPFYFQKLFIHKSYRCVTFVLADRGEGPFPGYRGAKLIHTTLAAPLGVRHGRCLLTLVCTSLCSVLFYYSSFSLFGHLAPLMSIWGQLVFSFLSFLSFLSGSTLSSLVQFLSFQSCGQSVVHREGFAGKMALIPLINYSTEVPPGDLPPSTVRYTQH